jgi:hypothetical protein
MLISKIKGAPGFEPGTSRSAVECSTTELYPHIFKTVQFLLLSCALKLVKYLKGILNNIDDKFSLQNNIIAKRCSSCI